MSRPGHADPPFDLGLVSVQFNTDEAHTIYRDTAGQAAYPKPQYVSHYVPRDPNKPDPAPVVAESYPVCYTRGDTFELTAKFSVANIPRDTTLYIKAASTDAEDIRWEIAEQQIGAGEITITVNPTRPSGATSTSRMFNQVINRPITFYWMYQLRLDNPPAGTPVPPYPMFASSTTRLYVTLEDPAPAKLFHTLLELSCHDDITPNPENTPTMGGDAAAMALYRDKIVNATWGEFADREVMRAELPVQLRYWSDDATDVARIGNITYSYVATLLRIGEGQCGAWADFLRDCLLCHAL